MYNEKLRLKIAHFELIQMILYFCPIIFYQSTNDSNTLIFALHAENKLTQLTQPHRASQTEEAGFKHTLI